MADNPYAPPKAPVEDVHARSYDAQPLYFPVAIWKFVIMYVLTIGIYDVYWFYKNWDLIRRRDDSDIWPFWRGFFAIFWVYPLFKRMRESGAEHGVKRELPAGFFATIFILSRFAWRAPGWYSLIGLLGLVVVATAQSYATAINDVAAPGYDPNGRFTGLNWLAVLLALLVFGLITIGLMVSAGAIR